MLNQLALDAGKKRLSASTQFVQDGERIATCDNFLYALALLKTKVAERVLEARGLISRLLPFQNENGNYPTYIHEWPDCKDIFIGTDLIVPLHFIATQHATALGSDLRDKVVRSLDQLQHYLKNAQAEISGPELIQYKTAFCCGLKHPIENRNPWIFEVPKNLGEFLFAYQVIDPTLKEFIPYLQDITHPTTHCYSGAPVNEYQDELVPETTLFDFFVAALSNNYPERLKIDRPINLWAAAIETQPESNWQPNGRSFNTYHNPIPENRIKGMHHFKYLWGNYAHPHSLVCQAGNFSDWVFSTEFDQFRFEFNLKTQEEENSRDVEFFLDYQPLEFLVNGLTATTFTLDDKVTLKTKDKTFEFSFEGPEGLVGHIMRGNRPAQIGTKNGNRYNSYDWGLFFRALQRPTPYRLVVHLSIL